MNAEQTDNPLVAARKRLKAVEDAWFRFTYAEATALTPEERDEAVETFASEVGNAVFGSVPQDTTVKAANVCVWCEGGHVLPDVNGAMTCNQCGVVVSS